MDSITEAIYSRLAAHLNSLPGGFAPSDTGADVRLLQTLFAPAEADLAANLTVENESAEAIASRLDLDRAETEKRLEAMASKGLIFSIHREGAATLYRAAPWIVGIYEYQVLISPPGLGKALGDYYGSLKPGPAAPASAGIKPVHGHGQMRTIPIGKSVEAVREVLPYERAYELVRGASRHAVAPCVCRREAKLRGQGCDTPEESCLMFDEWADYYARYGLGRYIDQAEVLSILARAEDHNLVLQPSNSQQAAFICCCCGCCCGVLATLKRQPKPAEAVASSFVTQYDAEACTGCQVCLGRCQMEALTDAGDQVAFDADRCIGCGLCVSTCPSGALTLTRKPDFQPLIPPDMEATLRILSDARSG